MTTDCITRPNIANRTSRKAGVTISPTEWGLLAIVAVGLLLMLPAAAFLVSHLAA
ncbi:hypothetical protein [Phenylobacterium sp.]|uniref:hypothetical protein n=1 Tax=Phenylobacterium sp. TaxID=1871053 RepID=UPI0035685DB9